jgi:hypothetical protein
MPGLYDPPDPPDLILSVRDLLANEVQDLLDGRSKFHVRVAVNILEIVARQLQAGPADEAAHQRRMSRLGFRDEAALAQAIRSGALDARYDEVAAAMREDVWDKVGVVNPGYRRPYNSPNTAREHVPSVDS